MTELTIKSTFHPGSGPKARDELDSAVRQVRLGVATEAAAACEAEFGEARVEDTTQGLLRLLLKRLPDEPGLLNDPTITIWTRLLYQALSRQQSGVALQHLQNLPQVLDAADRRLTGAARLYASGTSIPVHHDDLDPYIMAVTPPSYDFTQQPMAGLGHSLELQADLLGWAMQNIGESWPDERDEILSLAKVIGYLPDATFRSCSAARYVGVVYLGNQDQSILDIEESLVHEVGHQRLYLLGEVAPLTTPDAPMTADFVLPWSGQQRDLFGFLHACYIYVLLVKYFWRRAGLNERESADCAARAELIFVGLLMALPNLRSAEHLSANGKLLVEALHREVESLRSELLAA